MFKNAQFFLDEDRQILFIKHFTKLSKKTRILDLGYGRGYHLEEIQKISNFAFGFDKVCDSILPNTTKLLAQEENLFLITSIIIHFQLVKVGKILQTCLRELY